jgi:ribosomal protein S4
MGNTELHPSTGLIKALLMISQLMPLSGFSSHQKSLLTALQRCSQQPVVPRHSLDLQHIHRVPVPRGDGGAPSMLFALDQFQFQWDKGHSHGKKFSDYRYQLKERTKLGVFYGNLATHMVSRLMTDSQSHRGNYQRQMISLLEQRLDVVIFRSHFVRSIKTAQQLISHGHVSVNGSPLTIPSCRLVPGDVVSLRSGVLTSRGDRFREVLKAHGEHQKLHGTHGDSVHRLLQQAVLHGDFHLLEVVLAQKIASRIVYSMSSAREEGIHEITYTPVKGPKGATHGSATRAPSTVSKRAFRDGVTGLLHILGVMGMSHHLVSLHITRALSKRTSRSRVKTSWWLMHIKPVHLETSYGLSQIIYLYAPQRVAYPFPLQLDDVRRSF